MPRVVKHLITVEQEDGHTTVYLPPYRFEEDAKLAASQLIDIASVECAKVSEVVIEQ